MTTTAPARRHVDGLAAAAPAGGSPSPAPSRVAEAPPQEGPAGVARAPRAARPRASTASPPPEFRFGTRRRLLLAFLAVATVFVIAFGFVAGGLHRIEYHLAELEDHDEQMRLTLELENAIRSQFVHQAHFIVGEDAHLAGYRDARARAVQLIAALARRVDEPEAAAWLADIGQATAEFDRIFEEQIAPAVLNREPGVMLTHDKTSALVHRSELNVDRIFALLRESMAKYHEEVRKLERATLRLAILFLVLTPLLALAVALYLSRSIARPLAVLGEGAARISAGDLATRIEIDTSDEFGALASKFNAMTAALKEHQEKLLRSEKLAGLGRVAAGIAHELNSPLQVMLGYLSLDRDRVRGDVAKHLAAIEREATRCKEIVDGLLQLARPVVPIAAVPVDLRDVADEVASAVQMALGRAVPAIFVEGEGTTLGTRGRYRQVVFNLVRNAAEAAGAAGRVHVEVSSTESMVQLTVSDTGPGVSPELRERIFEPFFTTKTAGTGLGLPIARAIAHALGGDLYLDDREGGGASFTLRVPRAVDGGA